MLPALSHAAESDLPSACGASYSGKPIVLVPYWTSDLMAEYTRLGGGFWRTKQGIVCDGNLLPLNVTRTRVFHETWATDGEKVFENCHHRPSIDAKTFVALSVVYAKDAAKCYSATVGVFKSIPKADPASFVAIDSGACQLMGSLGKNHPSGYAKDQANVYFNGNHMKGADPGSFCSFGNGFARDANLIYFGENRIAGANVSCWRPLGDCYSRDDKRVFFKHKEVKGANLALFEYVEPFDGEYAYDGKQFYFRGEACPKQEYIAAVKNRAVRLEERGKDLDIGRWQQRFLGLNRYLLAPDENLKFFDSVNVGRPLSYVEEALGPGSTIPGTEFIDYLRSEVENKSKMEGEKTPAGERKFLKWTRDAGSLLCFIRGDKVAAVKIEIADGLL